MSAIPFTTRQHEPGARSVRESSATLPNGAFLTIGAARSLGRVELGMLRDGMHLYLEFSAAQVRSVAVEMLACADALECVQKGGAI